MQRHRYQTRNKKSILDYTMAHKKTHFSANDVYEYFIHTQVSISIPTIYRQLDKMTEEGLLQKCHTSQSDSALYFYIEKEEDRHEHSLMRCTECGKTIPLECHAAEELAKHIEQEHNFVVHMDETVFYGKCEICTHL